MKKTMLKFITLLLAAMMLLSAVPAFAVEDGDVRIIVVAPKKLALKEGERYKLNVAAKDGGSLSGLTWESSDSSVVSVDSSGNLTAHKEGSAKVKVYSKDGSTDSSTCRVTVTSAKKSQEDKE
ncbi:MAG: Ig-like domain-containing protein, partial [Clostridia bacterium]|nr:Ig-like domain-containing protein [Clostridia bacterium]